MLYVFYFYFSRAKVDSEHCTASMIHIQVRSTPPVAVSGYTRGAGLMSKESEGGRTGTDVACRFFVALAATRHVLASSWIIANSKRCPTTVIYPNIADISTKRLPVCTRTVGCFLYYFDGCDVSGPGYFTSIVFIFQTVTVHGLTDYTAFSFRSCIHKYYDKR